MLLQGGAGAAIPYLKKLVEGWSSAGRPSRNSRAWREIAELAKKVIEMWAVDDDGDWDRPEADSQHRRELLATLSATGSAALLRRFIERIVVREFDGTEQEQLVAASSVLGAKASGELFAKLVAARMRTEFKACTKLLARLTGEISGIPKPSSAMTEAHRKIAGAAVKALPGLGSRSDADRWRWREDHPIEVATIVRFLEALRNLKAPTLMSAAVGSIAADPETFPPDALLVPVLEALRQTHGAGLTNDRNLLRLWQHAAGFLLARSGVPPREPTDWAQPAEIKCSCEDCTELKKFAADASEKTHRFRMAKNRRRHLHEAIDRHDLDMTHETERRGSPYTLVCTKTRRHHKRRVKQYTNDITCLKQLLDLLGKRPGKLEELVTRMRGAIGPSAS